MENPNAEGDGGKPGQELRFQKEAAAVLSGKGRQNDSFNLPAFTAKNRAACVRFLVGGMRDV